jgi:hypothetical protein
MRSLVVFTDVGQHIAGDGEDCREEDVLDREAHRFRKPEIVVADRLHLLQQP